MHCRLDINWRIYKLYLHLTNFQTPLFRRWTECLSNFFWYLFSRNQTFIHGQIAKLLSEIRLCQLCYRILPIIDVVECFLDVFFPQSRTNPDHHINHDLDIIFSYHRLGLDIHGVFSDISNSCNFSKWSLKMESGFNETSIFSKPLNDSPFTLFYAVYWKYSYEAHE